MESRRNHIHNTRRDMYLKINYANNFSKRTLASLSRGLHKNRNQDNELYDGA